MKLSSLATFKSKTSSSFHDKYTYIFTHNLIFWTIFFIFIQTKIKLLQFFHIHFSIYIINQIISQQYIQKSLQGVFIIYNILFNRDCQNCFFSFYGCWNLLPLLRCQRTYEEFSKYEIPLLKKWKIFYVG